ncbi:glycoside hydrolase family 3 N-terminal domain-containing protein [Pseudonocardia lacus]|uniref:glycoside hydrolase family 3 N-terminal domain-containing protein n=1 Tax=Pseudonocardia lacus TaxID=2835865 RepID=UPI001BDBD69C|nr:glycoside hydrolase family 3 N-terminal domain-containing protein [Pseudonocardia lacus]
MSAPTRSPRRRGLALAGAVAVLALLSVPAPSAAAAVPAEVPPLTGENLGPDRLPRCAEVVASMSPRERVAQRLMVGVDAADPAGTGRTVHTSQVGGIFIGGNATDLLVDQELRGVQAVSRIPIAVAVDDEGGRVQRIDELDGPLPSARAMVARMSPEEVRRTAAERAGKLLARGITMNMAPTVDVGQQPAGSVIGDRSFGGDAETVTTFARAYAEGQRERGVFTVLKHFPGHGHANGDSHRGRVSTPPLDELRELDLLPYANLIGPDGPLSSREGRDRTGVMVGHLDVPGLTDDLPTSLSPAAYRLLREDYGFDGLVLTDDLGAMKAVTGRFDLPEAVERALGAGADMALWSTGGDVTALLDDLEAALAAGRLDAEANDTAVQRVLSAKGVCGRS